MELVYVVYCLHSLISGYPEVMGVFDTLEAAQQASQKIEKYTRVYAFIENHGIGGRVKECSCGLDVTEAEASEEIRIYPQEYKTMFKPYIPFQGNHAKSFPSVPEELLPIFGFCGGKPVNIRKDRTGYIG